MPDYGPIGQLAVNADSYRIYHVDCAAKGVN